VVALCGRARRGWSCLAGPRRRRPSSASDAPGRTTLPQAPLATAMDGVANPAVCQLPPTSRFRGRASRRPRPPPRQCLRPAPEWKLRGAGPGFRPTSLRCRPPRHHRACQVPRKLGAVSVFAYSPGLPRWHDRLFLRALRVSPYSTGFRRPTPPAIVRDPHPSGGSRPAVPPLACSYARMRPYDPPTLLWSGHILHPTRFRSSVRRTRVWRAYPWAHALFPIGGIPPPCTDASYAHGQGFNPMDPMGHPPCVTPSGYPREPGGSRPSHRLPDDTPRLFVGLSAAPVGHRQSGSRFPDHRRRGKVMSM
jgi:hypothetical protein